MRAHVRIGDLADVFAVVATLGQCQLAGGALAEPRLHAQGKVVNLDAGVVIVELATDLPARPLQQRRDGVA